MERYCLQSARDSMSNQKFAGRLRAVKEREDQCIKMIYGYDLSELFQFQAFGNISCNF